MIPVFIEAAVRSLFVGLAVAVGLRMFKVRNVLAQKAAWGLVLVSALAMPLLAPVTAQWRALPTGANIILPTHPMTLLEELQAQILSKSGSGRKPAPASNVVLPKNAQGIQDSSAPAETAAPKADERPSGIPQKDRGTKADLIAPLISDRSPNPAAYIPDALRGSHASGSGRHINISPILPITFYCGIATFLLARIALGLIATTRLWRSATPVPAWQLPRDAISLQVRASSRIPSPLTVGSGILVPSDYRGWDTEKLRVVLAHERSHIHQCDFYLQLLASLYAALVWFSPLGWWLKHQLADLAEAISDRAGIEEAASCTSYAQILLEFAAAPRRVRIGVAMARPGSLSRRIERLLNDNTFRQCFAGGRRALLAVALVPFAMFLCTMLVHVEAASTMQSASPAPAALTMPSLPVAPRGDGVPLGGHAETSAPEPAADLIAVASPAPVMGAHEVGVTSGGMQDRDSLSFDRTLSAGGATHLTVSTGSGNIHITRGSGNQIRIHGRIHVNDEGSEEQARQIAAHPPIEQSDDTIQVGQQHEEQWHGISIDYQIEAPAGTVLTANSGSGDLVDEGVGQDAKLQTGSGDIRASGLEGPFMVKTGSGNIVAEQSGQGDVVAETGSGDIELKDIHGGFHGETGSGDIKANGTPSSSWTLQTGSGTIELWTGNAPLTLDASTASGSVTTEHEMVVQGSFDHHHVRGTLNGGGPTIRAQTGSGDISIH